MIAAQLSAAVLFATMISAATVPLTSDTSQVFDENTVTPGVAGFVAIILIAFAVVLLAVEMTRRIRRTRYRGEIAEKLDAEELDARVEALSEDDLDGPDHPKDGPGDGQREMPRP